jgi:divalent metal cation (Fe/Co/Zn/Cd) transporter
MSTDQAHAVAHEVQHRLRDRHPDLQDVTIHVEPAGAPPEEQSWENIAVQLRRLAYGLGVGVHDVWAYEVDGSLYMDVHLEADGALPLREAHTLASSLEERARAEISHLAELTTHIEPRGQLTSASDSGLEESQVLQAVRQVLSETVSSGTCHQVQVRRSGERWVISMHCLLPGELALAEAHRISDRIGSQIKTRLGDQVPGLERVIIHTEPLEE